MKAGGSRRAVVGSRCGWQSRFRREGQKRARNKALHRELEQVDRTYTLQESGEAYRGQFDPKSEPLTLENTLPWERIAEVTAT